MFLLPGEVIRTDGSRLFRTRVNGTDEQYVNPLATEDGMPGYAVQWIEVEGPFYDDPVGGAGYRLLFDRLEAGAVEGRADGRAAGDRPGPGGRPGSGRRASAAAGRAASAAARIREAPYEVESAAPRKDAERLLRSFLKQAYRRPVAEADVQRFLALFDDQFEQGPRLRPVAARRRTRPSWRRRGSCSSRRQPGRLDDHALATRLSLFLWNSIPTTRCGRWPTAASCSKPDVLRAQTERMLDDPKSRRFVEAFTDYWLDLRKIDDTSPSTTLYNDYELDDPLKLAALEETRLFFAELLRADLPARNIVDSDFTFLNERLADHYGIPGVSGVDVPQGEAAGRQRPRRADDAGQRAQGDRQRHDHLAGAARPLDHRAHPRAWRRRPRRRSVEAVEPDIRGAVTIRQQLDKHRADASCASCHSKMDPPGFALESFDVMGGYRERYRAVSDKVTPVKGFGMNGQAFAFHYALPVDSAGELPDGRPFKDVRELKKLLVAGRGADRAEPGPAVDGLRHRRAGAVLRPGGDREDPRRGEGQPVRRAQPRPRDRAERAVPEQVGEDRR